MMYLQGSLSMSSRGAALGKDDVMHQHGPDQLIGPIRGSSAWWRGLEAAPEVVSDGPQVTANKTKRTKRKSGIRQDLVDRVRKEIEAGTYDTPDKWEAVLDRLIDRLDGD